MCLGLTKQLVKTVHSELIAVFHEVLLKHTNALWRENVEYVNVKSNGNKSKHWSLNC